MKISDQLKPVHEQRMRLLALAAGLPAVIAALVLLLGRVVNRLVPWLSHYNIPDPITGGLLFAVGMLFAGQFSPAEVVFDSRSEERRVGKECR